jgi:hypothetical protein
MKIKIKNDITVCQAGNILKSIENKIFIKIYSFMNLLIVLTLIFYLILNNSLSAQAVIINYLFRRE